MADDAYRRGDPVTVIKVDQTLHGYSEGHRLLAASRRLSGESQRAMRTLSDLSGPRLVPGFADYLTGYTLSEEKLLCLARTWYADECDRPGCVWTHTLLLSSRNLNLINSLECLLPLFRRPSPVEEGNTNLELYSQPLSLMVHPPAPIKYSPPSIAKKLLEYVYGTGVPIVIPDDDSEDLQALHFALWRQAQGLAGITLQFCTGAIQPRVAVCGQFDLQTVPRDSIREIVRTHKSVQVCEQSQTRSQPRWVELLDEDLQCEETPFRSFLHRYGDARERAAIGAYARIYTLLSRESGSYQEVLETIAVGFPKDSEATALKISVAGAPHNRDLTPGIPEEQVLAALLVEPRSAFDADSLQVRSRFSELWHHNEFAARQVAKSALSQRTHIADEICDELYVLLSAKSIGSFIAHEPDTALSLISRKPELAIHRDVWCASPQFVAEAMQVVSASNSLMESDIVQIVTNQLRSRTGNVASSMVSDFPTMAAEAVLRWLREDADRTAPYDWKASIENATELADWLKKSLQDCDNVASIIRLASPASPLVGAIAAEHWLACADRCLPSADPGIYALLCCLGLDRTDEVGQELLSKSFPILYTMAEGGAVREVVWQAVAERLPATGWWWDKCRRMRVGLVKKFASAKWPPVKFLHCLASARVLSDMVQMWGWEQNERDFLGSVLCQIVSGTIQASEEFTEIAQCYARWFQRNY